MGNNSSGPRLVSFEEEATVSEFHRVIGGSSGVPTEGNASLGLGEVKSTVYVLGFIPCGLHFTPPA